MKKSLIAVAALAAVGAASAQSSVTLFGVIDVAYGSHTTTTRDSTGSIKSSGVMDGANAGNRIGFRGTEDLGGGMKANFVIEQGIAITNPVNFAQRASATGHQIDGFSTAGSATALSGAAGAFSTGTNRQSYVGISSDRGTVNIGYQYTHLYELSTLAGYAVGSEGVPGADKAHLHGQAGVGGTRANMIQYISPAFSGFTTRVAYGAGTGRESVESTAVGTNGLTSDTNRRMSAMLQYANGPASVSAAYTNMRLLQANLSGTTQLVQGAATSAFNVAGTAGTVALSGIGRTANLFQLGGSYDFGAAKLAGTYNRGKNGGASTTATVGVSGFNSDYKAYQIGVTVPFGAVVPFIAYGRATTDSNNPNGVASVGSAAATARTEDYRQTQVGLRYSLSKRTTAYAFYGQTMNNAAAITGSTSWYRDSKTMAGVTHTF